MTLNITRLTVKYHEKTVGFLERLVDGRIAFQYSEAWVKNGFSLSPFSLRLNDQIYISKSDYFEGLFGVFYDSLPDGWGALLTRKTLAKHGMNYDKLNALTKLSLVSKSGLGGLSYEPTQSQETESELLNLDQIAAQIEAVRHNQANKQDLDQLYRIGGASGGVRPKVHLTIDDEAWIIKYPSPLDPVNIGQLEFDANTKASLSGIHVNRFELFPSKVHQGYFGAKRFDRKNDTRVHVISLAALLETTHQIPNLDYAHLFQVIHAISVDQSDVYEAYKRMCFNVLFGNKDDHSKNTAFYYDERLNGYRLTPFYDITKTPDKLEHEMTVLGNGTPNKDDLIKLAKRFNLSIHTCQKMIEQVLSVIA